MPSTETPWPARAAVPCTKPVWTAGTDDCVTRWRVYPAVPAFAMFCPVTSMPARAAVRPE